LKTALITGAGRGIGYSIAQYLLLDGYRVIAVSRTERDLVKLGEYGDVLPFECDLSDASERKRLVTFCMQNQFVPDVLVNNAGAYIQDDIFSETSMLQDNLEINLIQVRDLTALFWEGMKAKGNAYVFNIVSVLGKSVRNEAASYSMAKHALSAYNQLLFSEGRKQGIKVTGIFPSSVYTSSWDGSGVNSDQLISPSDIAKIVNTCLSLSIAAVPDEIHIKCMNENF
jgi:short-subunit dehydrogenase